MIDKYMNAYLDRRMKYLIEEWQIATRNDIGDFSKRIAALSRESAHLAETEKTIKTRLATLEMRAKSLEARKK
jgi:hypothetical protein